MGAVLVALLLAQEPDLFGDEEPAPVPESPPPRQPDTPLVIPPADGPVPDGVPKAEEPAPLKPHVPRPKDEERAALQAERQHLLDTRPSFTVPTVVTTLGGVGFVLGGTVALVGLDQAVRSRVDVSFALGAALGFVGLAAFVFGLVWERETALAREAFDERIDVIDQELNW